MNTKPLAGLAAFVLLSAAANAIAEPAPEVAPAAAASAPTETRAGAPVVDQDSVATPPVPDKPQAASAKPTASAKQAVPAKLSATAKAAAPVKAAATKVAAVKTATPAKAAAPVSNKQLEATLKALMVQNCRNLEKEDETRCLAFFHPNSPARPVVQRTISTMFPVTQFKYDVTSFKLLATDKDYAYARWQQTTTLVKEASVPTAGSRSKLDALMTFRKHNGQWKGWSSLVLSSSVS